MRRGSPTGTRSSRAPDLAACVRPSLAERLLVEIERSRERLANGDASYFAERLPAPEQWRLLGSFRERVAFVDVEATGLGPESDLTAVGLYAPCAPEGSRVHLFVKGANLDDFPAEAEPFDVWATYNGRRFGSRVRPENPIAMCRAA